MSAAEKVAAATSGGPAASEAGGPTTAPGTTSSDASASQWVAVCRLTDLEPERGAAALLDGQQLALVRLLDDRVLAVQQLDPFSGAHVISRGIVGSRLVAGQVRPTIASPMYKQVFDLESGECLDPVGAAPVDGGSPDLRVWPVRVTDGQVAVRLDAPLDDASAADGASTASRLGVTASDGGGP